MNTHNQDTRQPAPFDLIIIDDSAVDLELEIDALREAGLTEAVRKLELYRMPLNEVPGETK